MQTAKKNLYKYASSETAINIRNDSSIDSSGHYPKK